MSTAHWMQGNFRDFILQEANIVAGNVILLKWNTLGNVSSTGWYISLSYSASPEKDNSLHLIWMTRQSNLKG